MHNYISFLRRSWLYGFSKSLSCCLNACILQGCWNNNSALLWSVRRKWTPTQNLSFSSLPRDFLSSGIVWPARIGRIYIMSWVYLSETNTVWSQYLLPDYALLSYIDKIYSWIHFWICFIMQFGVRVWQYVALRLISCIHCFLYFSICDSNGNVFDTRNGYFSSKHMLYNSLICKAWDIFTNWLKCYKELKCSTLIAIDLRIRAPC